MEQVKLNRCVYLYYRNTNVRVTGVGCPVRPASADYVVANLMYNRIALGEHYAAEFGHALPSELMH